MTYDDAASGQHRMAVFRDGALEAALFVAPSPLVMSRAFVAAALTDAALGADGPSLLAGRPGTGRVDKGETVCACFQVGANQIRIAITDAGCITAAAVGATLRAGTNCGSCRPEIERMIRESRKPGSLGIDAQPLTGGSSECCRV